MRRADLVNLLVLNEIMDDYEEPQQIHKQLGPIRRSLPIELTEVEEVLVHLVQLDWAKAYDLRKDPPEPLLNAPPVSDAAKYYYWTTEHGREVHAVFDEWPYDDEGGIAAGWEPPLA